MRKNTFWLWLLCLSSGLAFSPAPDYAAHYGSAYQSALQFCNSQYPAFQKAANDYHCEALALQSIVFPELIRYNVLQNFFETKALELGYIEGGSKVVDFSIGQFQMKPSFAEQLEKWVNNSDNAAWASDFEALCTFESSDSSAMRRTRLQRLSQLDWQLRYLSCFYKFAEQRLGEAYQADEKIRRMATLYNCGINTPDAALDKWSYAHCFPYGTAYPAEKQHCYSDIAVQFYKKMKKNHPL